MPTPNEKKRYTTEEFYKLVPETNLKVELIDGEIVSEHPLEEIIKGSPALFAGASTIHQDIVGGIYSEFRTFVKANKGGCRPFTAPLDVEFDSSNTVQPDVFIVCDPNKIGEKRVNGAPDLVVEVVSSNRSDDFVRKLQLYKTGGVREYWIVDPSEERTIVYTFGDTDHISFYTFNKPVPVGIWDNKLEVTIADLL